MRGDGVQVWHGIEEVPAELRASVATIGNFDGVHLGHRAVLGVTIAAARAVTASAVAVTFDPHPAAVHRPDDCPVLLSGLEDRLELLAEAGLDAVLVIRYDLAFAALTPREFVSRYLVEALKVRGVVVGEDIRFGLDNSGDRETMRALGQELGFAVDVVHDIEAAGTRRRWSSTWVRELLAAGDVEQAEAVLGRPHRMRGVVVHGEARGRELGFPTANLAPSSTGTIPADGVYAGWLWRRRGEPDAQRLPAAISVGTNPTFDGEVRQVEAHVLGRTDLDLYDEEVVVEFTHRLRPTLRFDGIEPLIVQMHEDVARAADLLDVPRPLV
ncbi:bifunctional riboflavin kinase/FAD synthetase [Pseudactinotalea suaedae]|uniref:bifunctional riboflavin kinase/FAD synthetase n=1 Tax=Pseudactinotalea suaedae TaxID=1524924 RepID=UPI0012E1BCC3|nr:bifunctional riboflavin kinase/FAD synthetase [Pseudactinotalea suaedae]